MFKRSVGLITYVGSRSCRWMLASSRRQGCTWWSRSWRCLATRDLPYSGRWPLNPSSCSSCQEWHGPWCSPGHSAPLQTTSQRKMIHHSVICFRVNWSIIQTSIVDYSVIYQRVIWWSIVQSSIIQSLLLFIRSLIHSTRQSVIHRSNNLLVGQ